MNLSLMYSNRAACYLKIGDSRSAITDCGTSLNLVPHSSKPLLRRAAAYEALEKWVFCVHAFCVHVCVHAHMCVHTCLIMLVCPFLMPIYMEGLCILILSSPCAIVPHPPPPFCWGWDSLSLSLSLSLFNFIVWFLFTSVYMTADVPK